MQSIRTYISVAFVLLLTCFSFNSNAQEFQKDTLHLSLDSAESTFLRNNLLLLAQKYNVDAQKALIIQAKLWPNPNISLSRGPIIPLKNPTATFFNNSENAVSVSQLVMLAGKRNKQIKLAEANVKLSEYQFYDLLRTLKYTLRGDFFNTYYLQQSAKVYDKEISALQQVVKAFNEQEGKGYISEKEVVRIKAQLYSLQSEYNDLINQINDIESETRLVLQIKNVYIIPETDTDIIASLNPSRYPLTTLIDSAYKSRTDLMIDRANTEISRLNYNYQKSLAVPDLTLSLAYDQQGSYVNNFNSAGVAIDLPFFNRNQGNIRSAKTMIDFSSISQKSTEATIEEQVSRALQKAFDEDKLYKKIDPPFSKDFERLMHEVLVNYERRNIGLLDFLDFYDSYKQNTLQINSILFNRVQAFEDINFYTGSNFFN